MFFWYCKDQEDAGRWRYVKDSPSLAKLKVKEFARTDDVESVVKGRKRATTLEQEAELDGSDYQMLRQQHVLLADIIDGGTTMSFPH